MIFKKGVQVEHPKNLGRTRDKEHKMKFGEIENKFEVGDEVFISEPGSCYPFYYSFLKLNRTVFTDGRDYLHGFTMGHKTPIRTRLEVVDYGKHGEFDRIVYVVKCKDIVTGHEQYYIDGLEHTKLFYANRGNKNAH